MTKTYDSEYFHSPGRDPKLEIAIGRFFIVWGQLEAQIDETFPILFRTDPTLAICIYANLGTRAKLDILSSAISMLKPLFPVEIINDMTAAIGKIRNLSGSARNVLAHGQPMRYSGPEHKPKTPIWLLSRMAARDELDVAIYPQNPRHWERLGNQVLDIAYHWSNYCREMQIALAKVSAADIDRVCVFRWRVIEQASPYRRTLPRLATRGSKDRSAKRGRHRPSRKS